MEKNNTTTLLILAVLGLLALSAGAAGAVQAATNKVFISFSNLKARFSGSGIFKQRLIVDIQLNVSNQNSFGGTIRAFEGLLFYKGVRISPLRLNAPITIGANQTKSATVTAEILVASLTISGAAIIVDLVTNKSTELIFDIQGQAETDFESFPLIPVTSSIQLI